MEPVVNEWREDLLNSNSGAELRDLRASREADQAKIRELEAELEHTMFDAQRQQESSRHGRSRSEDESEEYEPRIPRRLRR